MPVNVNGQLAASADVEEFLGKKYQDFLKKKAEDAAEAAEPEEEKEETEE
jgi:hypothetical protein